MDQVGDGAERREGLLHESRTVAPKVAVESISQVAGATMPDDGPRDMGPAHRCSVRFAQHIIERDSYPEPLKVCYHRLGPANAVGSTTLQKLVECCRVWRQEVPEDVHLAPRCTRRELTAANDSNVVARTG